MCDTCLEPSCDGRCEVLLPQMVDSGDTASDPQAISSLATEPSIAPTTTTAQSLYGSSTWSATTVTFGIATSAQDYSSIVYSSYNEPGSFLTFSDAGKDIIRDAFSQFNSITSLNLVETSAVNATIKVGGSTAPSTAWAYSPGSYEASGDIWYGVSESYFSLMVAPSASDYIGSYEYVVSLHEIGHSLGLKHPHEGSLVLDTAYDGLEYSVMSYRSYTGAPITYYTVESWGYPQSLMMLDVAAIQGLYGADYTTHSGDTVYMFDPTTGEMTIDGIGQGTPGANRVFRTLWDGDGVDLIDLSNYTTDLDVNLNEGRGIDLDVGGYAQRAQLASGTNAIYAANHVYMSLLYQGNTQSLIENATGGSGNDILTGNQVSNVLIGGLGDDILTGGLSADTLTLGAGADTVSDSLAGLDGDTVTDFDETEDRVVVTGVTLTAAQVSLDAAGILTMNDGSGPVTLDLGIANAGKTVIVTATTEGTEITLGAYAGGTDTGGGDTGGGTTPVIPDPDISQNGSAGDDTFIGGTGDDTFLLRYGNDTATGDAGADTFILDWRYAWNGDSHAITDLDFSQGDILEIRLFNAAGKVQITSQSELDSFTARSDVFVSTTNSISMLTLDDGSQQVNLTLGAGTTLTDTDDTDTGTTVDAPITQNGSAGNDTFIGGTGDDTFLLRYGNDTATGDAGADTFILDWRYAYSNDSHVITDLDFSEGDVLEVRLFGGSNKTLISSQSELDSFTARSDVSVTSSGSDNVLTLDDGSQQISLTLGAGTTGDTGDTGDTGGTTADPDQTLNGGAGDDTLVGGTGDDKILSRYGDDIATGDEGADTFIFDMRYVYADDSHTITDLDFSEGDILEVRLFGGSNKTQIRSQSDLDNFAAGSDVTLTDLGLDTLLELDDGSTQLDILLAGY